MGYEDINPDNSVHVPILNGDISFLNSIAHVLLKDHDDVIDWDFVKEHATGWEEYVEAVQNDYSPEQVQDRMGGPNHDVSPELIRRVAGMFADATRKRLARSKGKQDSTKPSGYGGVIIMWGIGYNQHIHGQHNVNIHRQFAGAHRQPGETGLRTLFHDRPAQCHGRTLYRRPHR